MIMYIMVRQQPSYCDCYSLNYNVEVKRGRSRECTGGNKLKIRCMRIVLNFATFGNLGILNILNLVSSIWNHIYGSVSAGREKWPFNVLFFLKSRASV